MRFQGEEIVVVGTMNNPGTRILAVGDLERMLVKAKTTIQRSDFGMVSMPGLVSDSVTLCMSVEAVRYAG